MSVDNFRKQPMHQRLFNTPMEGGPSPKHLSAMIRELCRRDNRDIPTINNMDVRALATWLKGNYSPEDIEWAHRDRVDYYERMNKNKNRIFVRQQKPVPHIDPDKMTEPIEEPKKDGIEELKKLLDRNDQENKKKFKQLDDDEKYVLKEDYISDRETIVDEFAQYDNKIKGQQKAVENALAIAQRAENAAIDGVSALDKRLLHLEHHAPTTLKVEYPNIKPVDIGIAHKQFPLLVQASNARLNNGTRLNIWAYGPAGTGKTHAAQALAQAHFNSEYCGTVWTAELEEEFKNKFNQEWKAHDYNGALATQFQVFGYMDANGRYVSTAFRRIWEYGGVYLFDEIDGSMPDALLALQGALSSEYASFPDGLVKRHPDCIIIAGANTTGLGGGIEYIGAMKQNAAFLNRWVWLEWPHDDALEDALCDDKKWVRRVRQVRKNLVEQQIRSHLITMRQSMQGAALLKAGVSWDQTEKMTLRGGLTDAQWERVSR